MDERHQQLSQIADEELARRYREDRDRSAGEELAWRYLALVRHWVAAWSHKLRLSDIDDVEEVAIFAC
jgi:DNA-directed RNA polymerase specialized sigma subunit